MEHVCTSFDVGGRAKGKITLHGKKERIHRQKIIHTCCEIRLKCLTLPRLSLLAISGVQTLGTLHSETRSFDRQNHLTAMLKTELLQHYACCVVGNEPAIKFSTGAKDGACRRASWFSWHEDQPLYVDRFPSTEDLSWSHCAIGTVSIQDVLISLIGLLTRWKAACIILYTHTGKNLRFPPDVAIYRLNNLIFNWYFSG